MNNLLTHNLQSTNLAPHLPNVGAGLCNPNRQGAIAMRRQAHGFFNALTVMVGGVLGGLTACRILDPVCKPDTSSAALSFATPDGGLTTVKESSMNNLLTWLVANAPLRYKIQARLVQIRYQRAIRVSRALLLPPTLTREV